MRPFGKLDLGDQHGFNPLAASHDCGLLQLRVDACQEFFRKAGPDSAGELEPVRTLVANEQGTKIFPVPFGQRVTADYELARLGDVVFDPGTAAPAAFVERISSFGDQSLEAELLGNAEQFIFAAAELVRGRVVSVTRAEEASRRP